MRHFAESTMLALLVIVGCGKQQPAGGGAASSSQGTAAAEFRESGEVLSARGLLRHFPQDVRSTEAWLGNEFMVGETPVLPTSEVTREALLEFVGEVVEIVGPWNPGTKWQQADAESDEVQTATPMFATGADVFRGSGIEATSMKKVAE